MATGRPSSNFPLLPLSEPAENDSHWPKNRAGESSDNDSQRDGNEVRSTENDNRRDGNETSPADSENGSHRVADETPSTDSENDSHRDGDETPSTENHGRRGTSFIENDSHRDGDETPSTENHGHRGTSFIENESHRDEHADARRERRVFLDTSKWDWRKILTFITIWLAFILIYAAFSAVGAFFPNRAAEKGSSPAATGVIIGCAPLCVFLFVPVFRYLLPEVKLKYIFSVGLFFVGGAYVILGYALALPSGWIFITVCVLLRSIEGIGSAMFLTAFFSLLPQLYPNHMGLMTGMVEAAVCLGFSIGLPIGGLLYTADGFKFPFLVIGGIHLAFIPPAFVLVQRARFIQQLSSWRNSANLVCNLTVILSVICNIICLAALTFFVPTLSPYLTSQFHLSELEVSLEFLIAPVVYVPSAVVVGLLCDKLRPRYFIIFGAIICGNGYFFVGPAHFITQPVLWLTIVAHGSVGVGAAMGTVPFYRDLLDIGKSLGIREDQGGLAEVAAGVTASSLSFGFIGPFIGGLLTQFMDFQTSAVVFGEAALAQGCLLLGATLINTIIQRMELET